jgi:hypothetical protein
MAQNKGPSINVVFLGCTNRFRILPQIRPQFKMADFTLIGLYFVCEGEILYDSMGYVRGFGEAPTRCKEGI